MPLIIFIVTNMETFEVLRLQNQIDDLRNKPSMINDECIAFLDALYPTLKNIGSHRWTSRRHCQTTTTTINIRSHHHERIVRLTCYSQNKSSVQTDSNHLLKRSDLDWIYPDTQIVSEVSKNSSLELQIPKPVTFEKIEDSDDSDIEIIHHEKSSYPEIVDLATSDSEQDNVDSHLTDSLYVERDILPVDVELSTNCASGTNGTVETDIETSNVVLSSVISDSNVPPVMDTEEAPESITDIATTVVDEIIQSKDVHDAIVDSSAQVGSDLPCLICEKKFSFLKCRKHDPRFFDVKHLHKSVPELREVKIELKRLQEQEILHYTNYNKTVHQPAMRNAAISALKNIQKHTQPHKTKRLLSVTIHRPDEHSLTIQKTTRRRGRPPKTDSMKKIATATQETQINQNRISLKSIKLKKLATSSNSYTLNELADNEVLSSNAIEHPKIDEFITPDTALYPESNDCFKDMPILSPVLPEVKDPRVDRNSEPNLSTKPIEDLPKLIPIFNPISAVQPTSATFTSCCRNPGYFHEGVSIARHTYNYVPPYLEHMVQKIVDQRLEEREFTPRMPMNPENLKYSEHQNIQQILLHPELQACPEQFSSPWLLNNSLSGVNVQLPLNSAKSDNFNCNSQIYNNGLQPNLIPRDKQNVRDIYNINANQQLVAEPTLDFSYESMHEATRRQIHSLRTSSRNSNQRQLLECIFCNSEFQDEESLTYHLCQTHGMKFDETSKLGRASAEIMNNLFE